MEIYVKSSCDNTIQPSLFFEAKEKNRPLLVGLHTWSYNRNNQTKNLLPLAEKHDWNLLLPDFRGPNLKRNPHAQEACGSKVARRDVLDAIDYVKTNYSIDETKILLLGASGGGHMALLTASEAPNLFRAVGSFVPITDLLVWYQESEKYRDNIEACVGLPNENTEEYLERSPIYHAEEISKSRLKIFSGKWDKIVPCHHGLDMYNAIFKANPNAEVYFEMFDGAHEMPLDLAERWLLSQLEREDTSLNTVTG